MNELVWELFKQTGNVEYYLLCKQLEEEKIEFEEVIEDQIVH